MTKKQEQKITKDMKVREVIEKYPGSIFVFLDRDIHCIGCPAAPDETLEDAAKAHSIDLEQLLEELNNRV